MYLQATGSTEEIIGQPLFKAFPDNELVSFRFKELQADVDLKNLVGFQKVK